MSQLDHEPEKTAAINECPVEFCWGTFCRSALQEVGSFDFSLFHIMPLIRMRVNVPPELNVNSLPLGSITAFASFKRKSGHEGQLHVPLSVDIDFPGQKSMGQVVLVMGPEHEFCQSIMKFANPMVPFERQKVGEKRTFQVVFTFSGQEIGRIVLPVLLESETLEGS